ncbi:hypothetical protein Hanom_Chr13g01234931 [Helianthus anomalus]
MGPLTHLKCQVFPLTNRMTMTLMTFVAVESSQDALKQLFLIVAIDENGTIMRIGKTMSGIAFYN